MTEFEKIETSRLIPYARNARTHSDAQVAQIAASIKEFGFLAPVVVGGDYGIMAGHGRVLAARMLGLESVPCIKADHLTEQQKRAYIIADNRLAETSEWDHEMLAVELADLGDIDLGAIGLDWTAEEEEAQGADSEKPTKDFVYEEHFSVLVECTDAADQEEVFNTLTDLGRSCKVLVN